MGGGGGGGEGGGGGDASKRVFVGNLAYETSWQDLKDFMRKAGEVQFSDIFVDARNRSKGCGYGSVFMAQAGRVRFSG